MDQESHNDLQICPACSSVLKTEELRSAQYPCEKKEGYPANIYFCQGCELGVAYPLLSEAQVQELYFNGGYWKNSKKQKTTPNRFPGQYVLAQARWRFLKEHAGKDLKRELKILDIGAGHGFYGMIASSDKDILLKEYCSIEADQALREALQDAWQQKKYQGELKVTDTLDKVNTKYDLIVLSHILEHVRQPKKFLERVSGYLEEGGLLFVDIPRNDYLFKRDVFPHLFFFSKKSIEALIESIGLDLKACCCYGRDIEKAKKESLLIRVTENLFYKARRIMPKGILIKYFAWRLKAFYENDDGTWRRLLAERRSL